MEIYSIDEAFLRLDRMLDHPLDLAQKIRATVLQWSGIPVSIGIGPTKTLAKVANRMAKKHPGHGGTFSLVGCPGQDHIWARIDIEDVWGHRAEIQQEATRVRDSHALQFSRLDKEQLEQVVLAVHVYEPRRRGLPCHRA